MRPASAPCRCGSSSRRQRTPSNRPPPPWPAVPPPSSLRTPTRAPRSAPPRWRWRRDRRTRRRAHRRALLRGLRVVAPDARLGRRGHDRRRSDRRERRGRRRRPARGSHARGQPRSAGCRLGLEGVISDEQMEASVDAGRGVCDFEGCRAGVRGRPPSSSGIRALRRTPSTPTLRNRPCRPSICARRTPRRPPSARESALQSLTRPTR